MRKISVGVRRRAESGIERFDRERDISTWQSDEGINVFQRFVDRATKGRIVLVLFAPFCAQLASAESESERSEENAASGRTCSQLFRNLPDNRPSNIGTNRAD